MAGVVAIVAVDGAVNVGGPLGVVELVAAVRAVLAAAMLETGRTAVVVPWEAHEAKGSKSARTAVAVAALVVAMEAVAAAAAAEGAEEEQVEKLEEEGRLRRERHRSRCLRVLRSN